MGWWARVTKHQPKLHAEVKEGVHFLRTFWISLPGILDSSRILLDNVALYSRRAKCGPLQAGLYQVRKKQKPSRMPCRIGHTCGIGTKQRILTVYSHDSEDGAVLRNIDACRTIAQTVQTSLGPFGRNKIVVNHLQKMILTSDAATILRELEVVHPAAKLLVMASQQQDAEMGDATNMVIVFAGELLKKAEELLRMGLKTSDIVQGYEKAQSLALKCLNGLFGSAQLAQWCILTWYRPRG